MGFERDLGNSTNSFENVVAPKIIELGWLKGDLQATEGRMDAEMADNLDTISGIDVFNFEHGQGSTSIASRIQFGKSALGDDMKPWNTFSVRYKRSSGVDTEYQKRLRDLRKPENECPYYTLQAYMTKPEGEIISMAMIRTEDLIYFVRDNLANSDRENIPGVYGTNRSYETDNEDKWADFYWVKWWHLDSTGRAIRTFPEKCRYNKSALESVRNNKLSTYSD